MIPTPNDVHATHVRLDWRCGNCEHCYPPAHPSGQRGPASVPPDGGCAAALSEAVSRFPAGLLTG